MLRHYVTPAPLVDAAAFRYADAAPLAAAYARYADYLPHYTALRYSAPL